MTVWQVSRIRSVAPLGVPHYTTQEENVRKLAVDNVPHLRHSHLGRWVFDSERLCHYHQSTYVSPASMMSLQPEALQMVCYTIPTPMTSRTPSTLIVSCNLSSGRKPTQTLKDAETIHTSALDEYVFNLVGTMHFRLTTGIAYLCWYALGK